MIIGIGTDIIHISRFRDMDNIKLNMLANKICTDNELIEYQNILDILNKSQNLLNIDVLSN
jgi:phosphopantetheinyl transferase (holo-ACP synthase)